MADNRELDELLDRALASYVDAEPHPSLRARMSARITSSAEAAPRNRQVWLLGPAAACVAAALFVFLMHPAAHAPLSQPGSVPAIASASEPPAAIATMPQENVYPRAARTLDRTHRQQRPALAHASSFPIPSQPTTEESILLKFVAEHPEQARQVLTVTGEDRAPLETKPLSIAPIHIAALKPPEPLESEE